MQGLEGTETEIIFGDSSGLLYFIYLNNLPLEASS